MSEVQLIARHTINPGKIDEVLPLLPKLAATALTEPGCLAFDVFRSLDDEHSYVLLERYASRAAFNDHLAAPHYQEIALGYIVPRLEGRTIEQFDVIPSGAE